MEKLFIVNGFETETETETDVLTPKNLNLYFCVENNNVTNVFLLY